MDRSTGEIRPACHDPDAALHFEGDGEAVWGTKFVLVAARTQDVHGRVILDVEWTPNPGAEARTSMECFVRLAPLTPGAQGIVYDTALRGVHHQQALRDLGLMTVNRVAAAVAGVRSPRRGEGRRRPKSLHIEDKQFRLPDGTTTTLRVFAQDGSIGLGELTATGDLVFRELRRVRTHRNRDRNGRYRWYNDYELPENYGRGTLTIRLHGTDKDRARRLNRTENVRPIPPDDPDFARLFQRRNDAESINRAVEDSLYIGRAHSVGHARQHLNLLGFALMVNSLALYRHRQRPPESLAA